MTLVLYYNPNIFPEEEHTKRIEEQRRLIEEMKFKYAVKFMSTEYTPNDFYEAVKGAELIPEGGERCFRCYYRRLLQTAQIARSGSFDYFTTTLSISPLKNAERLNKIGEELAHKYQVGYLYSDFKKRNGYQRSVVLSKEYGLYRQTYCGCVYSQTEREKAVESKLQNLHITD